MAEGLNPTRRYTWFRPRQAARGLKVTGTPVNRATVSIFNSSTGPQYLIVRDIRIAGTASDSIQASFQNGQIGTSQGLVAPMVSGDAAPMGLIASIDTATAFAGDNSLDLGTQGTFTWYHDYPFAVIQPGVSLVLQDPTVAHGITVSAIWEAILSDQLDFWGMWQPDQ